MNAKNLEALDLAFNAKVHFWGRLSLAIAFFVSFSIPFYLTFIAGHAVDMTVFVQGLIFVVGFVGIIYFIEPISYFPVLGAIGTYMSFLSGNIGNMRMPVVGAVQNALNVDAGTRKAEMAAVFGLVASNIVNLLILFGVIVGGSALVQALPQPILASFSYAVPGIIGAMLVIFGEKMRPKHLVMTVILGLAIIQLIKYIGVVAPALGKLLAIGQVGVAAACAIVFAIVIAKTAK
ncbi:MAG: hypothetical protein ACK5PS_03135 [Desulfopila sp.]